MATPPQLNRLLLTNPYLQIKLAVPSTVMFDKTGKVRTYNVILRCVRVNIFAVERQQVLHIFNVCSLGYNSSIERV